MKASSAFYRWIVLIIASFAMFGNYYLYDSVAYVALELKSSLGFTDEQYGLLYSMYSIAAIGVLFFSGMFIDKFGTRLSILLFGAICTISGFYTAYSNSILSMLISRFVLGFGAEPLIVALTVAVAKWFKGKELGFALGINLFIARLGTYAVDLSNVWAEPFYTGWQKPLILAAVIGSLCMLAGIAYYILEWNADKKNVLQKAGETDKLELRSLVKFTPSFWYIVLLCMTFYSAVFPFRGFAPKFYVEAHGLSDQLAGQLNSILALTAMFATPLIGLLIDKTGRRASMMFIGAILIMPVYLMMIYVDISLFVPVTMLGIAFSLIPAVMWPSVAYIVDERRLGTAYALMTLIQQAGVAFFAWLIGWANEHENASAANPGGYNLGMWLFSILGILGFIFAYRLYKHEKGPRAHGLEKPTI